MTKFKDTKNEIDEGNRKKLKEVESNRKKKKEEQGK